MIISFIAVLLTPNGELRHDVEPFRKLGVKPLNSRAGVS